MLTTPWNLGATSCNVLIWDWASGFVLLTNSSRWTFWSPPKIFSAVSCVNSTTNGRRCFDTNERRDSVVTASNFSSARPSSNCTHQQKVTVMYSCSRNPSHSYGLSLAIWDHAVLSATRHKWTYPTLTLDRHAGNRLIYPRGMGGWVNLNDLLLGMYRIAIFKISRNRKAPDIKWTIRAEPDICNSVKPSQLTVIQYESKIRN